MSELFQGLAYLGNWVYWLAFGVAVLATVLVRLLPGVSTSLVVALALPFIAANVEDALIGIVMLATLASAGVVMRSVTPVLFGLPDSANYVTFLEGNQLARRGQAAHTLGAAFAVSAIGGLMGVLVFASGLLIGAPLLRLFLSAPEVILFVVALLALVIVALLNSEAMLKGLAAAALGLLLGTSGLDPFEGPLRSAFDESDRWRSFFVTAAAIGALGLAEVIDLTVTRQPLSLRGTPDSRSEVFRGVRYGLGRWRIAVRQGFFGALVGLMPGTGTGVVQWLSYALGIFLTKDKREFGRGSLDGLLLAESAVGAGAAGGATPTVLFGIPGSSGWAFVLVALLSYGIAPGPQMLEVHGEIVTMMVLSLALGMPAVAVIGVLVTGRLVKLARVPYPVIGGIIIPIFFLGFTSTESLVGIYVMAAAAVLGLLMKWCKWPRPPLVMGLSIGFVLNLVTDAFADRETVGMTVWSMPWPALAVLAVAAVVAVVVFKRGRIGVPSTHPDEAGADAGSAGEAAVSRDSEPDDAGARPRIAVTPSSLFTMAVIVAGLWGLYVAAISPLSGWVFPLLVSFAVVGLGGAQLAFDLRQSKPGRIMDIGLRSLGMADARRTALLTAAMMAVFMALLHVIGLRYATILFPLGPALLFLEGRTRWIGAGVGVALLAAFNAVLVLIEQHAA